MTSFGEKFKRATKSFPFFSHSTVHSQNTCIKK